MGGETTTPTPFGRTMRTTHWSFSPTFTPLNHGSFGAYPSAIQAAQDLITKKAHARPDPFIKFELPRLLDESREAIAPLLGVDVDEVVFVPTATYGVDIVLRNLDWEKGDVVVHFSTIYIACLNTLKELSRHSELATISIPIIYPITDDSIVTVFQSTIKGLKNEGKKVKLAIFDTVSTFPGVRVPWEELVRVCREDKVLSCVDGAHGIGMLDFWHLGKTGPDFWFSNCHKWLYTPRASAVFYVPFRNQHLIRSSIPTGVYYEESETSLPKGKTAFVHMFEFVATADFSPYLVIPVALRWRREVCGGEEAIRSYCNEISRVGGAKMAEVLGTEVLGEGFGGSRMIECGFANVRLPLAFAVDGDEDGEKKGEGKGLKVKDASKIGLWIRDTAFEKFDTYLQIAFHGRALWVRLSGQIYLEVEDFEKVGERLKELCRRVEKGEFG